jgi:hypothetical protein
VLEALAQTTPALGVEVDQQVAGKAVAFEIGLLCHVPIGR